MTQYHKIDLSHNNGWVELYSSDSWAKSNSFLTHWKYYRPNSIIKINESHNDKLKVVYEGKACDAPRIK